MFHKRLLKEFGKNKKNIVFMILSQWIMLLCNVFLMFVTAGYVKGLFERALGKNQTINLCITFLLVFFMRSAMTALNQELSRKTSDELKDELRNRIYEKLMHLGSSYRENVKTSEIVQITTEGVEQLEIYFGKYIPQFFYSMLAPITLFVIVGTINLKVAAVLLLCVPFIPVSIIAVQKFAKKMLAKYWGTYTELGDSFLEGLHGLTTLKIYQADENFAKKMDEESEKFRKVTMRVLIMQLNSISIMDLVAYGGAAIGIGMGILELQRGNIDLSQCFFIVMIAAEFFLPLRLLGSYFHIAMNGNAAADKIFKLLDMTLDDQEIRNHMLHESDTVILAKDLCFSYEDNRKVLDHLDFELKRGLCAFVGESGCGKSTLVSLLMGENSPSNGILSYNDNEISELPKEILYNKITRIRHDSYLFSGTVRENLNMGKRCASEREMYDALNQVNLLEFIQQHGGLDMILLEKASNLSGGQKQRLAIARALLHDTDIYIFDEATSNVDVESENDIMEVIEKLSKTKLVILISHRLANVTKADKIFVLTDGQIKESGKHKQLLLKQRHYHRLYMEQKALEQYGSEAFNGA